MDLDQARLESMSVADLEDQLRAGQQRLEEINSLLKQSRAQTLLQAQQAYASLQEMSAREVKLREEVSRLKEETEMEQALLRAEERRWAPLLEAPCLSKQLNNLRSEAACRREAKCLEATVLKLEKEVNDANTLLSLASEAKFEAERLRIQHAEGETRLLQAELSQLKARGQQQEHLKAVPDDSNKLEELDQPKNVEAALAPRAAEAPTKGPPKGKGKGKGKPAATAMPPPPPKSAAVAKAKAKAVAGLALPVRKKGNLVAVHWKVLPSAPVEKQHEVEDPFMNQTSELLTLLDTPGGSSASSEAVKRRRMRSQDDLKSAFQSIGSQEVNGLRPEVLEVYFKRREATVLMDSANHHPSSRTRLLDEKRVQMLGILLKRHMMANKGETEVQAVFSLKRAVLRCDYDVIKQEGLGALRNVLQQHEADGKKIEEYVKTHGEAALDKLDQPYHHRLVHELLKVPQIDERLECMLFTTTFADSLNKCMLDLNGFCDAIKLFFNPEKRKLLQRFFQRAHRLGKSLNRNCRAPQAEAGFELSSIDRLVQTKCPLNPKFNLMHFTLALMSSEDAAALFSAEEVTFLARGKAIKSFSVYKDCCELVQGFYAVREICETGRYTSSSGTKVAIEKRRKTRLHRIEQEAEEDASIDSDDLFLENIQAFVRSNEESVRSIGRGLSGAFHAYKELGVLFGDLNSVYPPPKDEKDSKVDLIAVMHRFADYVRVHRIEVEQERLREQIVIA